MQKNWRKFLDFWVAPWTRNPKIGLAMVIFTSVVTLAIAICGPSATALKLGPRHSWLPPWYFSHIQLPEWLAVIPLWLAIPIGGTGLWVVSNAIATGWRPGAWRLYGLGSLLCVLGTLVTPLTSADVLMYSAYGRIQNLGIDPWTVPPAEIYRRAYDPVIVWVERPWQDTPSVYGPIPSFSQWLAAHLGGANMHDVVFWLQVFGTIPFLVIGAVLILMAKNDELIKHRAALFTVLNPLLIWAVVAGAHNEALCLVFAVLALYFMRNHAFAAGLFIGLAGCTKVSLVFYGLAMVWGYRFVWKNIVKLAVGALIPIVISYGLLAPKALFAAGRNVGYISAGSWSPWPNEILKLMLPEMTSRQILSAIGWLGLFLFAWILSNVLEWRKVPGGDPSIPANRDPVSIAVRTAIIISAAWFITSPYTMPWYDLLAWVPIVFLGRSKFDWILIWRGVWLSAGYVTGRAVEFTPMTETMAFLIRDFGSTAAQYVVFGVVVYWWYQTGWVRPTRRYFRDGWQQIKAAAISQVSTQ